MFKNERGKRASIALIKNITRKANDKKQAVVTKIYSK